MYKFAQPGQSESALPFEQGVSPWSDVLFYGLDYAGGRQNLPRPPARNVPTWQQYRWAWDYPGIRVRYRPNSGLGLWPGDLWAEFLASRRSDFNQFFSPDEIFGLARAGVLGFSLPYFVEALSKSRRPQKALALAGAFSGMMAAMLYGSIYKADKIVRLTNRMLDLYRRKQQDLRNAMRRLGLNLGPIARRPYRLPGDVSGYAGRKLPPSFFEPAREGYTGRPGVGGP